MSVTQFCRPRDAQITCTPETTMSEFALACQMAFGWFLGHGIYRLRVARSWKDNNLLVEWDSDLKAKPLEFTLLATFKNLRDEGYIPQRFAESEVWSLGGTEFQVILGQQRVSSEENATLIDGRYIPSDQSLMKEAWAMSDLLATAFVSGAKQLEYQVSLERVQIRLDKVFSAGTVRQWFDPSHRAPTYSPQQKVTQIP